jgi:hypothetical protein
LPDDVVEFPVMLCREFALKLMKLQVNSTGCSPVPPQISGIPCSFPC